MFVTFTSNSLKNIDRTGDMNGWTMTDDSINRGGRRGLRSSDLEGEQKARACLSASYFAWLVCALYPCRRYFSYVTDLAM